LHKELGVPVGVINCSWGGTIAEAWASHEGLLGEPDFEPIIERAAQFDPKTPNQATNLYDGMLHPLIPFGIRGAIWYQGESNCGRAQQYRKLFPAMITDWRKNWGQGDFPFLFVQLAPFRYGNSDPKCLAELWEAQLRTLALPNTGMAVTTDIGNVQDIHPKNKQEVLHHMYRYIMSDLVDAWKATAPFTLARKSGWTDTPEVRSFRNVETIIAAKDIGAFLPRTPVWSELADAMHRAVQKVLLSNVDAKTALDEAAGAVDRATAEFKRG